MQIRDGSWARDKLLAVAADPQGFYANALTQRLEFDISGDNFADVFLNLKISYALSIHLRIGV